MASCKPRSLSNLLTSISSNTEHIWLNLRAETYEVNEFLRGELFRTIFAITAFAFFLRLLNLRPNVASKLNVASKVDFNFFKTLTTPKPIPTLNNKLIR